MPICLGNFLAELYGPADLIEFCKYGVGWDITIQELQEIGECKINMMRMFNLKSGFDRKDDCLPPKAFLPIPSGLMKALEL